MLLVFRTIILQKNIGIIGLGSMGYGIAQSILKAGHITFGSDMERAKVEQFIAEGGESSPISENISQLDVVVVVVLNATQTEQVLFGENGIVENLKNGACVITCATVPPEFARNMSNKCMRQNICYLDAPISGGSKKAATGDLSVMASGSQEAFAAAKPVLDAMAQTVFNLGGQAGTGSAMKAVNQMLAGVHIAAMAEAITFGISQGIAPAVFAEIIPKCAGTSWMLENRTPHIVEGDYTPHSSIDIWPKDLGIVLDIARQAKFSAPITAAALQQFLAASGSGLGQEDDSAVAKIYARNAGLELPTQTQISKVI